MAPGTTNAFLLSFASGRFVDSHLGKHVGVHQKGRQPECHGPRRITCGERRPKRSIEDLFLAWLACNLKKIPMSIAPIEDLQQSLAAAIVASSKTVQVVSSPRSSLQALGSTTTTATTATTAIVVLPYRPVLCALVSPWRASTITWAPR